MMQERRAAERLRINIDARWEGLRAQGRGAVCDLSRLGCFVLTSSEVEPGELVRLEVNSSQEVVLLWGQAVYAIAEMGFALRFVFGKEADKGALDGLIGGLQ